MHQQLCGHPDHADASRTRRQSRAKYGDYTLDCFRRHAGFQAHLLRRALQPGPDCRHVQHREQDERVRRQSAVQQCRAAHCGLRPAPVSIRDEAELVKQPTFASVVCRLRSTALRSRALRYVSRFPSLQLLKPCGLETLRQGSAVRRSVLHFAFTHPWRLPGVRSPMPETEMPTTRTRVVRESDRAVYDREPVYRILDEGFLCHVGFAVDGQPFVIPTSYGRKEASLYIHGSAASRMLRQMKEGVAVCITVTLLDGLVLARSVFNHSMNYRSVVILGVAQLVDDPAEKLAALRALSEHIIPGRWEDSRQPNDKELKATSVLRLPITEFSAKVRVGPAVDDEEDYSFPTWAGVIPLDMTVGTPIRDERCERELPGYLKEYSRTRKL